MDPLHRGTSGGASPVLHASALVLFAPLDHVITPRFHVSYKPLPPLAGGVLEWRSSDIKYPFPA